MITKPKLAPYTQSTDRDGKPCVDGPGDGFGFYAGTVWRHLHLSSAADALAAAALANTAYAEGYRAAKREVREALGIDDANEHTSR